MQTRRDLPTLVDIHSRTQDTKQTEAICRTTHTTGLSVWVSGEPLIPGLESSTENGLVETVASHRAASTLRLGMEWRGRSRAAAWLHSRRTKLQTSRAVFGA